jgi:predicted lipoprotein with Yx(FWY)xxD motif
VATATESSDRRTAITRKYKLLVVSPVAAALVIAGCGGSGTSASASRPATSTSPPVPSVSAVTASVPRPSTTRSARKAKVAALKRATPKRRTAVTATTSRKTTAAKANPPRKVAAAKTTTPPKTATTAKKASPRAPAKAPATVALRTTPLGKIITDSHGRTLYLFAADKSMSSTCNGACASAWPPLSVTGQPVAGPGLQSGLLGTTKRAAGATQVTYGGHPLYYYAGDSQPGQTTGQDLTEFGAKWLVLSADGAELIHSRLPRG